MEQKHVLLSTLSVGVGVGVGLGLNSGQKWIGGNRDSDKLFVEQLVQELKNLVVEGRDNNVTFEDFPYYLSFSSGFRDSCLTIGSLLLVSSAVFDGGLLPIE